MTNIFTTTSVPPLLELLSVCGYRVYTTLRGISPEDQDSPYSGFNVCHYTGDTPEHVAECRKALADAFATPPSRIIIPRQTHSTNTITISSAIPSSEQCENVDAVISARHDIITGVNTADCVPVMLIDPAASVSAAVHAGWRGAAAGIVTKAIEEMRALGADLANIHAVMGPSICVDCFEVGPEVAAQFPAEYVVSDGYPRPHVSLQEAITGELISAGITSANITPFPSEMCTRCHPAKFFSARRLGVNSGRVFTFIVPPGLNPRPF